MRRVTLKAGLISFVVFAMLAGVAPMAAAGASPKAAGGLGAAAGFAVLAGTALTCTNSTVTGPVGVSSSSIVPTQTGCTLTVQVAPGAYAGFLTAYSGIAGSLGKCTVLTGTLAGVTLKPGTYCFDAAAVLTGTLTLTGTGPWLFEIGTSGTGALTATDFTVVGSNPCNVTWWVRQAVTLTRATFQGTILGGTDITLTDTSLARARPARLVSVRVMSVPPRMVPWNVALVSVTAWRTHHVTLHGLLPTTVKSVAVRAPVPLVPISNNQGPVPVSVRVPVNTAAASKQ